MDAIEKTAHERAYGIMHADRTIEATNCGSLRKRKPERKQGTTARGLRAAVRPRQESFRHNCGHKLRQSYSPAIIGHEGGRLQYRVRTRSIDGD